MNSNAISKEMGTGLEIYCHLKNTADFAAVDEVYGGYFPSDPPARATGEVSRLPKDVAVEMDFAAWKG